MPREPAERRTVTVSTMRTINRTAVLDMIRLHSPISRTHIAHLLHASLPTIMRSVDDLVATDLVRLSDRTETNGGRPSRLLEFNGPSYAVVGVDLGGSSMYGTVADLSGRIQHEIHMPQVENDPEENLQRLYRLIEDLLSAPRPSGQSVRGIGVGAPGVTCFPEGMVTWAPSLGWRDLPLQALLSQHFEPPVLVENDVNLAALGEHGFGAGRGVHSLVCLAIGTGVGAGIILNGALYRGFHLAAGEIGYLLPAVQFLRQRYERYGALETLASGTGIAARARQLLQERGAAIPAGLSAEHVFSAARLNETWACQVLEETADYLSLAIAAVSCLLDPELVVLGGGITPSAAVLLEPLRARLEGTVPFLPRLEISQLGYRAAVMGAIMLVLSGTMEHLVVERTL
jgi:predicted NBD/HSP70 family sugar kinase